MSGMSDYSAQNILDYITGQLTVPALPSIYLALFTTAPTSDSGAGAVEVAGGSYTRVQVAGPLTTNGTTGAGSAVLHFSAVPSWLVAGMSVRDATNPTFVPANTIIASINVGANTVTMSNTVSGGTVGNGDSIVFSAFAPPSASSGTEPLTAPALCANGSTTITFPQASANWGTVTAFGLYDASSSGNLLWWDYLGNYKWIPFSCTLASPGVLTVDSASDAPANSTSCVVTQKYGGTLPATSGSWAGVLTSAGLAGATFNLGVNTTSIGGGLFRQIVQQSIPINVIASFAAGQLTVTLA